MDGVRPARSGDVRDALVTEADEVVDCDAQPGLVVGRDSRGQPGHPPVDEHERQPLSRDCREVVRGRHHRPHQEAVDPPLAQQPLVGVLAADELVGVRDQDRAVGCRAVAAGAADTTSTFSG